MRKNWFASAAVAMFTLGTVLSTATMAQAAAPAGAKAKVIEVRTTSSVFLPNGGGTLGAVESVVLPRWDLAGDQQSDRHQFRCR